jgi:hypothetical protein
MSILTELLQVFTEITPDILDIYIDLFGLPCDIYNPLPSERLYDDHSKIKYNKTPDETGRQLLIVNFIHNNAMRGGTTQYESFFGEYRPYIITHEELRLPPRTRIDAWLGGAKMSFQTEIDEVITGVQEQGATHNTILIKQLLRPLT